MSTENSQQVKTVAVHIVQRVTGLTDYWLELGSGLGLGLAYHTVSSLVQTVVWTSDDTV